MPSPARDPRWPAWYTPEDEAPLVAPNPAGPNAPLPSWYVPEPESVTVSADRPESFGDQVGDLTANIGTGVARVPGAIIGTPQVLMHTLDWLGAKIANLADGGNRTGADVDAQNPVARNLPTSQDVDNKVFQGISAVAGRDVHPYEPTSILGKLLQAGVTGAGAGVLDPAGVVGVLGRTAPAAAAIEGAIPRMVKTAIAGDAANATQQAFPDSPGLAAGAALLAHAGASGVGAASRAGGGVATDATRQVFRPKAQGELEAGRVLGNADNTGAGLASPTDADLANATAGVKATTDAIPPGQQPWQAGAQLRAGLQTRSDALRADRAAAGDKAYDAFRAQPALPSSQLEGFMRAPSFRKAVSSANAAVLDEGGEPLTDYFDFNEGGEPVLKANAAVPPDVLGRVKSWLASSAANAPAGSAEARTAGILDKRFGDFLDTAYPATKDFPGYAAVRQAYADAGKPLGDFAHGPVAKALDAEKQFGQSRYTLADERVPDLFLRSKATRADLNQLVAANGGNRTTALGALQDHLAGVAQIAVRPDGTLDVAAFDKAMQPYKGAMTNTTMWFPELAQKFNTSKQAQASLENLQAQRGLADAVRGGALRDSDGMVTAASLGAWLRSNGDAIAKTQTPGARMRLQSIAGALQNARPGELADALKTELLPAALGTATGGLEGGVLATLLHKTAGYAFRSLDAKRQAAFSAALEQAVLDPGYAIRLAQAAAKQGRSFSPARALVRAVAVTPLAASSANVPGPQ
jgi:hypothetical protein